MRSYTNGQVLVRVKQGGVVIAPLISGTERSGRTGSSICGTQCKRTVPCLKCIKNFKEVIAEPATRSGES